MTLDIASISNILDIHVHLNPAPLQDFWFKLIPLLSPVIVIATFALNNWYTRKTKKQESKRSWYFKAYLEPHLKKTEEFFTQADKLMEAALKEYKDHESWSDDYRTEFIGEILFKLADSKRKFEIEVVKDLQATYPKIFTELGSKLLNFEDSASKAFEEDNEDRYFAFLEDINSIKNELIKALSGPAII